MDLKLKENLNLKLNIIIKDIRPIGMVKFYKKDNKLFKNNKKENKDCMLKKTLLNVFLI